MKLLIVDDEKLTREGLAASIDWEALGISRIFQADDGVSGLQAARREKPEIILCDVRMPRMDGIHMAAALEEFLPDSAVVFMSGYSDKEYLKAAIKLKAVNYVEKPLDPEEIREAVLEAKERFRQKLRTRRNEDLHSANTASALALALTRPYKERKDTVSALARELSLRLTPGAAFTAYLVQLAAEPDEGALEAAEEALEAFLAQYHLRMLHVRKRDTYQVFMVYGAGAPSASVLAELDRQFTQRFSALGAFYVSRGETVSGIARAYQSYASAVTLMQSGFFFDCGTVLAPEAEPEFRGTPDLSAVPAAFAGALADGDRAQCGKLLDGVYAAFSRRRDAFACQAKDLYYKLFMHIQECRRKRKFPPGTGYAPGSIMESMERCFALADLHGMLLAELERFFAAASEQTPEDPTVFLIKEFIGRNYSDENLSVREISEHVSLSPSYVCTYFKNMTGQTLNQYLTACRIEKAKQLLGDPRSQIADISSQVGYSNGNYFGKSFKKLVGLSPSEYREKILL